MADGDAAKVSKFLDRKGASGKCPICGVNAWMVNESSPYARIPAANDSNLAATISPGFYAAYLMYCTNCGFTCALMKHIVDGEGGNSE
jgi:hypothetical protein